MKNFIYDMIIVILKMSIIEVEKVDPNKAQEKLQSSGSFWLNNQVVDDGGKMLKTYQIMCPVGYMNKVFFLFLSLQARAKPLKTQDGWSNSSHPAFWM